MRQLAFLKIHSYVALIFIMIQCLSVDCCCCCCWNTICYYDSNIPEQWYCRTSL